MTDITTLSIACVLLKTFSLLEGANCTGQTLSSHVKGGNNGGQKERGKLKRAEENPTVVAGRKVLKLSITHREGNTQVGEKRKAVLRVEML